MDRVKGMKWQEERYLKGRSLARSLKKAHWRSVSKDPNIIGAAFGQRTAHGEKTDEPALVFYVIKKSPRRSLMPSRLLPRRLFLGGDCVEVDVVETGPIYAFEFTGRERPATAGISIGHLNVTAGTLGSVVIDNTDGTRCILSNNHVMADENAGVLGDAIVQPGVFDGGSAPADTIATLKRFVMINASGNRVDGAIAQITNDASGNPNVIDQVHNNIIPVASPGHRAVGLLFAGSCNSTIMNPIDDVLSQLNISFPAGAGSTVAGDIGMNVEKVGRTTEYTTSTIREIDATVQVGYDFGVAEFDGQLVTSWMSDGGDSGSVVYEGGAGGDEDKCGCGSESAAAVALGVDLKQERCMAEVVRDKFLRETRIGRWAVDLFYANEERALQRFAKTDIDPADREYARKLYDKYIAQARAAFVEGEGSSQTVTDQHIRDARASLKRAQKYMSRDERDASEQLLKLAEQYARGKNARQLLALLNDEGLMKELQGIAAKVQFLEEPDKPCR